MTPSRAIMACCLVASTFIFAGLPRFILVAALCIPFQVGCPWITAPYLFLRCRPLTTLGRPPPTVITVAVGPAAHSGQPLVLAICRWSILTWHQVSVGEEEGGAGREWQTSSLSPGCRVSSNTSYTLCRCQGKEKGTTEAYLSEDIVIVVACLLQCLQILCIINKPKAAAITYGLDKKSRRTEHHERACSGAFCEKETLMTEGWHNESSVAELLSISVHEPAPVLQRTMCTVLRQPTGVISSILKPSNPLIAVPIVSSLSHITVTVANISSSPLHRVTIAALIGVTQLVLAECPGGGRGILIGVVVGMSCRAPLSGNVSKPNK
ncbi:hypothetical protein EDB85DRAFT_1899168 [Lactarius pseudohatsudake]|nr:hypothetical protein EDB85DRAFT_1899168 [Lactarius pseudohatsudake]